MLDAFFTFLFESLQKGKWGRSVFVLMVLFLVLNHIESHTKFIYITSIKYQLSLLSDLNQLDKEGISDPVLKKGYKNISAKLIEMEVYPMEVPISSLVIYKFVSGSILGISFIIWSFRARKNKREKQQALRGALSLTFVFGFIGILFPIWFNNIILSLVFNSLILIAFQFSFLLFISKDEPTKGKPRAV